MSMFEGSSRFNIHGGAFTAVARDQTTNLYSGEWRELMMTEFVVITYLFHILFGEHLYSVPMDFNGEVKGSTSNDVGHDQLNFNNFNIVIHNISHSPPGSVHHHRLQTSGTGTIPQDILIPKRHLSSIVSTTDFAVRLIVNIVHLLHVESADECRHWERELKALCQSLNLTRLAIQAYEYTSLGQNLAKTIFPEVERCCGVLREILDKIIHYRESLKSTKISGLWRQVLRSRWDVNELASLGMGLSDCREPLDRFLMALNSYVCFTYLLRIHR
jgi:hypothetical protein